MPHEFNPSQTIIVCNGRSGMTSGHTAPTIEMLSVFKRELPDVASVLSFEQAKNDPSLLRQKPNVLTIGGDGSISWVSKHLLSDQRHIAIDGSTVGVIPHALHSGKGKTETPTAYALRMIHALKVSKLNMREIPMGCVVLREELGSSTRTEPFVFTAGMGNPMHAYTSTMEALRGKVSKPLRSILGYLASSQAIIRAPIFTVVQNGTSRPVYDMHVFKYPFSHNRKVPPTDRKQDMLLTINALETPAFFPMLAVDSIRSLLFHLPPLYGALSYTPISAGEPIHIQTYRGCISRTFIDSEPAEGSGTAVTIIGSSTSGEIYRFAELETSEDQNHR